MEPSSIAQLRSRLFKWLMRKTNVSAIRRVGELPIAIASDIGNVRNENQDRVAVLKAQLDLNESFVLVALCDGMGGMVEGAVCASQTIASFFTSFVSHRKIAPPSRLAIAAREANGAVYGVFKGSGGGTLSAVLLDDLGGMTGVNIGDSRIYSFRENQFEQLTVDDTMAGLRPEADIDLRAKNELLQYVGMGDGLEPHIIETPLLGDMIVLSSDGAHYFDKGIMRMVIQNAKDPGTAAKRLVEIAKWCGGRDNASIAIASPVIIQQQSLDDAGLIQVWDPFGELQMFVAETSTESEIRKDTPLTPPPADQRKPQQSKRAAKAPKKAKPGTRKGKKAVVDQSKKLDDGGKERPQLNIYFNGDMDKDRNA